jgi:hypothetical protein
VVFRVLVDGQPRPVQLSLGSEKDVTIVSRWRAPAVVNKIPAVRDTLEFARLAAKRWRYYRRSIPTATSIAQINAAIRQNAHTEVSILLVARADWFPTSSALGLAQCRRTYCHHLVLEFLSVHPRVVGGIGPRVRGVGSGLLYCLAEFAGKLRMRLIWGEATAYSAPFYAKALGVPRVQDHFFIRDAILERCRHKFRDEFFGDLSGA